MKHLKQKLIASVLMLTVAAAMLTTSTFAWFAISTAPEVTDITTTIETTEAFEIALGTTGTTVLPSETTVDDAGDDTKWGSTVTTVTATTGLNFPLQVGSNGFETVKYDATGRTDGTDSVTTTVGEYVGGIATVTAPITIDTGTETKNVATSTLLWLRSNVAITGATATVSSISLKDSTDTEVTTGDFTADDINVAIAVKGGTPVELTSGSAIEIGNFGANEETYVEVYVYFDGAYVTNEIMSSGYTITIGSIIFAAPSA